MHGDDAVAALDNELVELYRARPELGSECSDSDKTGISNLTKDISNCRHIHMNVKCIIFQKGFYKREFRKIAEIKISL